MKRVILVGNPNTGKTTLFNTMTGSTEKVSNWHGVTVGEKCSKYKFGGEEYEVVDLPGMYSLESYSNEERIAKDFLLKNKDALIINICDANNLRRNLKLTLELLKLNLNVLVVINMSAECQLFDYVKLTKLLGVKIIEIDARKKRSIVGLKNEIKDFYRQEKTQNKSKIIKISPQINDILQKCAKNIDFNPYYTTDKIDKIVLNKFLFLPLFIVLMFLIFWFTFGAIGGTISSIFISILNNIADKMRYIINCTNINIVFKTIINEAILGSVLNVFSFLPQIVLLMFFFNLIEECGLMSRIAFMFDGVLKKVGLTGKSLFSIFMGYGCTTSAVITTRNLENENLRKRTALLLPFSSCSAKLPVFLVISSLFFDKYKYLFVFLLYIFSIVLILLFALIYKKIIPTKDDLFILEMPKYRVPSIKKCAIDAWVVIKEFLVKVGSLILFFSVIVWILQNFSFEFKYLNNKNFNKSMLYNLSKLFVPVFSIIGLGSVGIVVAIFSGVVAKEMIVVSLSMLNGVSSSMSLLTESLKLSSSMCSFSPVSSIVFLVFVLIYSPCISALVSIKNELGLRQALYVFVVQFVLAFLVSFLIYKILSYPTILIWALVILIVDILVLVVLKLKKKKTCRGNCCACRKI